MKDSNFSLDYGEQLVMRYRTSGMTRKDLAARSGVSVSTLNYYVRRERKASLPDAFAPGRLLPVEFAAPEGATRQASEPAASAGIRICLASGRALEVERGFDAGLLFEVLAALGGNTQGERA
ncbi:MAG: helix-turn-helix transcriptional regulator [Bryobacterales bacterium]|nr:helix-turn-helix transcriptional regulator [Bryobacterales bacterium]